MKITKVSLKNFASYPELVFDFGDLGLTLVSGDTGSGKSTLLDAASWVIFGVTSKEGAADDVKAWDTTEPTVGLARVHTASGEVAICRVRGKPSNDLHFCEVSPDGFLSSPIRGKDLGDTQKLIDKRLGVNADLFLTGSYLTQFSKADSFFIAKAKDRREVLEKIADQEFAVTLGDKASEARKVAKAELEGLRLKHSHLTGKAESLRTRVKDEVISLAKWNKDWEARLIALANKFDTFDQDQAKVEQERFAKNAAWAKAHSAHITTKAKELASKKSPVPEKELASALADAAAAVQAAKDIRCEECGGPLHADGLEELEQARQQIHKSIYENKALALEISNLKKDFDRLKAEVNPFAPGIPVLNPYGDQLEAAKTEVNPFEARLEASNDAYAETEAALIMLDGTLVYQEGLVSSLTWLYDKSFELRALLMARVVSQIESSTNNYLEKHFDAALRVRFSLPDSDKLEIEISNNGYPCPFKSLSGGERTMLKLAFSLSLMRAAQDKAGVSFDLLMLDEPMNGLSGDLKVKAFGLLQELEQEYGSVLVIEHSEELKTQFDRVFSVSKASGHSEIHEQRQSTHN